MAESLAAQERRLHEERAALKAEKRALAAAQANTTSLLRSQQADLLQESANLGARVSNALQLYGDGAWLCCC